MSIDVMWTECPLTSCGLNSEKDLSLMFVIVWINSIVVMLTLTYVCYCMDNSAVVMLTFTFVCYCMY